MPDNQGELGQPKYATDRIKSLSKLEKFSKNAPGKKVLLLTMDGRHQAIMEPTPKTAHPHHPNLQSQPRNSKSSFISARNSRISEILHHNSSSLTNMNDSAYFYRDSVTSELKREYSHSLTKLNPKDLPSLYIGHRNISTSPAGSISFSSLYSEVYRRAPSDGNLRRYTSIVNRATSSNIAHLISVGAKISNGVSESRDALQMKNAEISANKKSPLQIEFAPHFTNYMQDADVDDQFNYGREYYYAEEHDKNVTFSGDYDINDQNDRPRRISRPISPLNASNESINLSVTDIELQEKLHDFQSDEKQSIAAIDFDLFNNFNGNFGKEYSKSSDDDIQMKKVSFTEYTENINISTFSQNVDEICNAAGDEIKFCEIENSNILIDQHIEVINNFSISKSPEINSVETVHVQNLKLQKRPSTPYVNHQIQPVSNTQSSNDADDEKIIFDEYNSIKSNFVEITQENNTDKTQSMHFISQFNSQIQSKSASFVNDESKVEENVTKILPPISKASIYISNDDLNSVYNANYGQNHIEEVNHFGSIESITKSRSGNVLKSRSKNNASRKNVRTSNVNSSTSNSTQIQNNQNADFRETSGTSEINRHRVSTYSRMSNYTNNSDNARPTWRPSTFGKTEESLANFQINRRSLLFFYIYIDLFPLKS